MNIVFIVTHDSVNIPKPPMATAFTSWVECSGFVARWFPEISDLDLFDDVITCEGLSFANDTMTVNIKAGALRGKIGA